MKPLDILLVEDNPGDARLTREALAVSKVRNTLHHARDGEEAIAFLRHEPPYTTVPRPDLVLLDLNLPRRDGREVLENIKNDPLLCSIPIVILTSSQAEEDILRSYRLHANCFITKPVDLEQLTKVVQGIEEFWFTLVKLPPGVVTMLDQVVHVLLVEDNPGDARLVAEMLKDFDGRTVSLTHVETVAAALAHLSAHPDHVHAVLLDLSLPDEHGLDTVRRILAADHPASVVVMTGDGDEAVGDAAVEVGAQDYLIKNEVTAAALRKALRFAMKRQDKHARLEQQSLTDQLTGLHNRRGFMMHGDHQLKHARRSGQPVVLLFIDLDDFKHVNDTYGHAEGDRALQKTAAVLKKCLRESDIKGRLGGDEFVGLAVNASEAGEVALRARLENALRDIRHELPYTLNFSIGLCRCDPTRELTITMEDLLRRADALMYEEKRKKKVTQ